MINRELQHQRRAYLIELAGGKCVKCGSTDRLEFDHIDPKTKLFQLTSSRLEYSIEKVLAEFRKCQLLCKPCHIKKSILERGRKLQGGGHGTDSMYNNGKCRCADCKLAHAEYMRGYKVRKKLALVA